MYKPLPKKSSSWTPTSIQKKSKNFSKPGSSAVPARRDAKSTESQEMPCYSTAAADLLAENIMRGMETQEQEQVETSTVQRQSSSQGAAVAAIAPPIVSIPVVQSNVVGKQMQCSACATEQLEQSGEEGKDVDQMSTAASGIQTKLTIGTPGDVYEQEAERMAQQVMSMSFAGAALPPQVQRFGEEHSPIGMYSSLAQSITPVVHRRVDEQVQMYSLVQRAFQAGGTEASGDLESRLNASSGGGSPLAPEVRAFMEPRFGADFSSVRVHTGSEAVQMNQELGAMAFTHGSDVYFGALKSPGNNELTAHELTHVVQQTGGEQRNLQKGTNYVASEKVSSAVRPDISSVSTPSIQASFISFVVKMGAKKASLAILKKFIKEQIKDKITKIAIKKFTKQFAKEADDLLGILEDPWWVTAIGFIPVIGDGFDLVRVPKQIKTAINKANALEERVKKVLQLQGMKAGGLIPARLKNVKDYPTELEGRTYAEIVNLASGGSDLADKAKTMKKLIEQTHRLMEKI